MKSAFSQLITLLLIIGFGFSARGKSVDENTAKMIGSNFLISAGVQGITGSSDLVIAYTATSVVNGNTIADYYVFKGTASKTFVMVSGDDIIIPILAYSGESSFDFAKLSPGTKSWIDGYKNEIAAAVANGLPAKDGTADAWAQLATTTTHAVNKTASITSVAPLLHTSWNQAPGYNDLCPLDAIPSNGLSVTGCVATAMSQLMKFWNWPTTGCGSHTYTDPTSGQTLTADFGNTTYQWASMPADSSDTAIATLMFHAGVSVNMSYSWDESGSYVIALETDGVNCAEYALKTYFHYKPTLQGLSRYGEYYGAYKYYGGIYNSVDSIPEATWITTLQTELSAGRPMLYMGSGSDGGHCWVCDGWEASGNKFHFNWGWSGESNGYYTVDDLAPPALGVGGGSGNFNSNQGVVLGVEPDSFPSTSGNIKLLAHLNTATSSPMTYGAPLSITTKIMNAGSTVFNGSFKAVVYDTSNTIVDTVATLTGQTIAAGDSTATLTFNNTRGMYGMIPVSYNAIRVLYCPTGSTTWTPVANNDGFINYTIMDILNDTDVALFDSLHIGSHDIETGSTISVSTTVGNFNSVTFNGTLKAVLVNIITDSVYGIQEFPGQSIAAYDYSSYTFTNSTLSLPGGTYALEIQHQYNGTGNFYLTSSDFYANPELIRIKVPTAVAALTAAANDISVYPNPASDVMNIAIQGTGVTGIKVMDIQGRTVKTLDAANQSLITLQVSDLASGVYFVHAQTTTGIITKKIVIIK